MPKIAEVEFSICGLKVADFIKNCDCGIAELQLRSNISLKSCSIAIVEVLPSSCVIAIANSKKSCACPPLVIKYIKIIKKHVTRVDTFHLIYAFLNRNNLNEKKGSCRNLTSKNSTSAETC